MYRVREISEVSISSTDGGSWQIFCKDKRGRSNLNSGFDLEISHYLLHLFVHL